MRKFLVAPLMGIAAILPLTAAQAQDEDDTGFYIAGSGGIASLGSVDIEYYDAGGTFGGTGTTDTASGTFDSKSAATFGGTLGYDFGTVRSDLELSYSRNKITTFTINQINGQTVTLTPTDRDDVCDYLEVSSCGGSGNTIAFSGAGIRQVSAMANLWLDLPVGSTITPYAGGGLGIAGFEVDGEGKAKFAWQLGAGAAVKLSDTLSVTADFRHREVSKTAVTYDASSGFTLGKLKTDSFSLGLRMTF